MPQISVIVPVYKVEPYLRRCVDSILAQTFPDFELILVDDGSPDNCPAICDEYAARDSRVQVVHQENKGLGAARYAGIKRAIGEYVLFCDSDDAYADPDAFQTLMDHVAAYPDADLYAFDFLDVWEGKPDPTPHYPQERIIENPAPEDRLRYVSGADSHRDLGYAMWSKLYRKELIDRYRMQPLLRDAVGLKDDWCEDLFFNLQYFLNARKIVTLGKPLYLLSKHGTREQTVGYKLTSRVPHMTALLKYLREELQQVFPSQECKDQFFRVFAWHMKRYLYEHAAVHGVKALREEMQEDTNADFFLMQTKMVLKNWEILAPSWPETDSADYRVLLQYILTGNHLRFKLCSYWLWRIKPKFKRG